MNIHIDKKEIIKLQDFELGWRFDKIHNSELSNNERKEIIAFSENESKRLNKIIDFYEIESNRIERFFETDWFSANSENEEKINQFRNQVSIKLKEFEEDLIISWQRNLVLKTTKDIFLKYWTDFLYPNSDDVTIISENTNWIIFYRHFEVANIWVKNEFYKDYVTYKKNLYEIIELWSSAKKQLEFQKNVPIAHVSHELFNDWESYFADGLDFENFLSEKEINLFFQFNEIIEKASNSTPQILPQISEFIKTDEWKLVNDKAIEILKKLNT